MLKQAVLRYDIQHPVFNDRDFNYWTECGVNCWPTIMVIGPESKVLLKVTGEGNQDELEAFLHAALEYYDKELTNTEPLPI